MPNFLIDEDTDLLAAEFVLGTLDSEERANAQALLRTDHGFIAMVRIWERRFGELHLMVEPVDPDAKVFERIKAKIAEIAPKEPAPDGKPLPDGKSAVEGSPPPAPATATDSPPSADAPKLAEAPETLPNAETAKPPDAATSVAATVPADETAPKPVDVSASETAPSAESGKPLELPPAPALVVPGVVVPGPIIPTAVTPTTVANGAIPAPPSVPPASLKLPDQPSDRAQERPARRPDVTIDVVRSRNRWRRVGVCMTLLVVGLAALLAAWRFIPDRLPARLRPAELMTSIGIQAFPGPAPAVKPAVPVGQFDE
jgi:hypothetical protein